MYGSIKQRHLFTKRTFDITENSLQISVKKPFKYYEEVFTFEELGKKTFVKKSPNRFIVGAGIISLICLVITSIGRIRGDQSITYNDIFFYVITTILSLILFFVTYTNSVNLMLVDKRYIVFYSNKPDKSTVLDFINLIFAEQKRYLLNKYAKPTQYLSNEQLMQQLTWLKERYIIDESEFDSIRNDLFPNLPNIQPIGFTFRASSN